MVFNLFFNELFFLDQVEVYLHIFYLLSRRLALDYVNLIDVQRCVVIFLLVFLLKLTLLLSFENFGLRNEIFDLIISFLEGTFVLDELLSINIIDIVTLDIHASICVPTNSHQILVASSLVSEGIAYEHANTMFIVCCSVIKSSTTIVLADEVDWVQIVGSNIHTTEVFMWSFHGDLHNRELLCKLAVQRFIRINENTSTIPVLIDLVHDFRWYTKLCSQVNLWHFNLFFILSENQLVPHEIYKVTFVVVSLSVIRSCSDTDNLHLFTNRSLIELHRVVHDYFV